LPQNPSPAATQISTDQSPGRNRRWLSVLKTLLLVVGLVYVAFAVAHAIHEVRTNRLDLHVSAPIIAASAAVIFAAFLVLILAWTFLLRALSGRSLPFVDAARIWFVSNLSIYIPAGPGWQIVQMGVLSSEQGIGALPAGGAAIINAAINVATGIAVAAVAGTSLLSSYLGDRAWMGWVLAILAVAGVCALPVLLPLVFRVARDRLRRDIPLVIPAPHVILIAAAANVLAWILYGVALECLYVGILGPTAGTVWQFTATFATAYVVGYLVFIFPGGLGLREITLSGVLLSAGLATTPQGDLVAVASRLVLIVVQVIPALLFLVYRRPRHETSSDAG
jgi:glycosyltransferase 2 family protein